MVYLFIYKHLSSIFHLCIQSLNSQQVYDLNCDFKAIKLLLETYEVSLAAPVPQWRQVAILNDLFVFHLIRWVIN